MDKIKNAGYEIILEEVYHVRESGTKDVIALGRMVKPNYTKFVTWEGLVYSGGTREYFWGHYFETDERAAHMDYHKRLYDRYDKQ